MRERRTEELPALTGGRAKFERWKPTRRVPSPKPGWSAEEGRASEFLPWRAIESWRDHASNITRYIEALQSIAEDAAKSLESSSLSTFGKIASSTMRTRTEQNQLAYELAAFLAASRACIDFIANMLALHVKRSSSANSGLNTWLTTELSRVQSRQNWSRRNSTQGFRNAAIRICSVV